MRFELTTLRICNPFQLTTLAPRHKFGADSETRTRRILLLRQARIPIPSYPHWWAHRDSNSNLINYELTALPLCYKPNILVSPEGFEPPTCGVEDRCSIQLNYRRINLVRVARLELANPKVADFKSAAYTIPPHSHIWRRVWESNPRTVSLR